MKPELVILKCGADSLAGDLITHLAYTSEAHRHATVRLCDLADLHCRDRLPALGGGGYNPNNLADTWCSVFSARIEAEA